MSWLDHTGQRNSAADEVPLVIATPQGRDTYLIFPKCARAAAGAPCETKSAGKLCINYM